MPGALFSGESTLSLEAASDATSCDNARRRLGIGLNSLLGPVDVDVNRPAPAIMFSAPDPFQGQVAGKHDTMVAREEGQQLMLPGLQMDVLALARDLPARRFDT